MKTFKIEYELPPMRAIYMVDIRAENEEGARKIFKKKFPEYKIRKVALK